MLKIFKYILPVLILFSFGVSAAEVKVTAVGKMKYVNEYSEDVKDEAIILAKKAALKRGRQCWSARYFTAPNQPAGPP